MLRVVLVAVLVVVAASCGPPASSACSTDADCSAGDLCVAGSCEVGEGEGEGSPGTCHTDADCGPDATCINGVCGIAEGEGEGTSPGEGEGASPGEGEGEGASPGEGEGSTGEGEGEGSTGEGEGEGVSSTGEGEGEGSSPGGEGEGSNAGEGEGSSAGEGEGSTAGEGEGSTAGEGEGSTAGEGEGSNAGEGEGSSGGEGEGSSAGEGEGSSAGEGEGSTAGEGEGAAGEGEGEGGVIGGGEGEGEGGTAQFASCSQILKNDPTSPDGFYTVDFDGTGPLPPVQVQCDMTFDGGGWTLVMATASQGPDNIPVAPPQSGVASRLDAASVEALAAISQQVHIRSEGDDTRSVTSRPGTLPIQNLRLGKRLYQSSSEFRATDWTGPFTRHLPFSCDPNTVDYPNVYHACNNGQGLHIVATASQWTLDSSDPDFDSDTGGPENLEVWVRDAELPTTCATIFGNEPNALDGDYFFANGGYQACTRCGDGIVEGDEQCDDGNRTIGDGCSDTCRRERSCADIHDEDPTLPDGIYTIDPDGTGTLSVQCDMTFDGGGWTLVMASALEGPDTIPVAPPRSGTPSRLDVVDAVRLANVSTQVHIRTSGAADTRSATSNPNAPAIAHLRDGNLLDLNNDFDAADWTGPFVAHLTPAGCPSTATDYPNTWDTCTNPQGLHFLQALSQWTLDPTDPDFDASNGGPEDLEVWVGAAHAPSATCGDGVVDAGEECDDGNRQNGDGCDASCLREVEPLTVDGHVQQMMLLDRFDIAGGCSNGMTTDLVDEANEAPRLGSVEAFGRTWRAYDIGIDNPCGSCGTGFDVKCHFSNAPDDSGLIGFGTTYGFIYVFSPTDRDVELQSGSDDGYRVLVNGAVALDAQGQCRCFGDGQDTTTIHLVAGQNRVLVETADSGGNWGFVLRLVDASTGAPEADLVTSYAP